MSEQIVFNGFHQGSVMEDGALGPVTSYISLRNTVTGKIINVAIAEVELRRVVNFAHGDAGETQEPVAQQESGELVHPEPLDVDPEEVPVLQEEPIPTSAFPEDDAPAAAPAAAGAAGGEQK